MITTNQTGSYYTRLIMETPNCCEEDAHEVEDIMRHDIFHSTLDWQTKPMLQDAAREAWPILTFLRSPEGQTYVTSLNQAGL